MSATDLDALDTFRRRHQDMMARNRSEPISSEECRGFVDELSKAGAGVPPGRDRDALRNMLLFWGAAATIDRGQSAKLERPPSLAPFVGAERTVSADPAAPTQTAEPQQDVEALARARAVIRIAALARQWRATDEATKKGYLLTGRALAEASLYVDDDLDIRALVEASQAAEKKAGARFRTVATAIIVVLAVAVVAAVAQSLRLAGANSRLSAVNVSLEISNRESEMERQTVLRELARIRAIEQRSGAEQARNRDEAGRALEAITEGDLGPLRSLMERLSEARPVALDRLEIRQSAPAPRRPDVNTVAAPLRSTARAAPPPAAAASCTGFLWLGSDDDRKIAGSGNLSELRAGNRVEVNEGSDIRLREAPPSPSYVMARQVGLVPGGSTVTLTGSPQPFPRPTAVQYWAPVRAAREFCTSAFIQYVGNADRIDDMRTALLDLGVQVPPAERIDGARGRAEVRFFYLEDAAVAREIAERLGAVRGGRPLGVTPLLTFPTRPTSGTIEVWIDLGE